MGAATHITVSMARWCRDGPDPEGAPAPARVSMPVGSASTGAASVAGTRIETCRTHGDDESTFIASARVHSVNGVFFQNCCAACTVASAAMARMAAAANRLTALHSRMIQVTVAFLRAASLRSLSTSISSCIRL